MLRRPTQNILLRLVRTNSSQTPSASTTTAAVSTSPKPTSLTEAQSPNRVQTWSTMQRPRSAALTGPLFEQTDMSLQPMPLSAMQLVSEYEPVRVHGRRAVCDGGGGPLGHPKIYINLDQPGPRPCGYCGIQFEQIPHHGHAH